MTTKLQELKAKCHSHSYPENIQVIARVKNENLVNFSFNNKSHRSVKFYDVGSMTKIMVTVPLCMILYERKILDLSVPVENYLKYFRGTPVGRINIKKLLRHDSGLEAWRPYYKKLIKVMPNERISALKEIFRKEKVKNRAQALYSDLDFIILGWVIEDILDMSLDEAAETYIFRTLNMKNTFFRPSEHIKNLKLVAPTRKNKERGIIQGDVFDDNSWAMDGISGHAGLFSTAEDVTRLGQSYLDLYFDKSSSFVKGATLRFFVKRAIPQKKGDWGLGFTLPSRPVSTAGTKVSLKAFGHVGYTGTSLWIEPLRSAVVTVLSNGTYPRYTNEKFKSLRREIHDLVWELIDGQ